MCTVWRPHSGVAGCSDLPGCYVVSPTFHVILVPLDCSTQKMKALRSLETLGIVYHSTQWCNQKTGFSITDMLKKKGTTVLGYF